MKCTIRSVTSELLGTKPWNNRMMTFTAMGTIVIIWTNITIPDISVIRLVICVHSWVRDFFKRWIFRMCRIAMGIIVAAIRYEMYTISSTRISNSSVMKSPHMPYRIPRNKLKAQTAIEAYTTLSEVMAKRLHKGCTRRAYRMYANNTTCKHELCTTTIPTPAETNSNSTGEGSTSGKKTFQVRMMKRTTMAHRSAIAIQAIRIYVGVFKFLSLNMEKIVSAFPMHPVAKMIEDISFHEKGTTGVDAGGFVESSVKFRVRFKSISIVLFLIVFHLANVSWKNLDTIKRY